LKPTPPEFASLSTCRSRVFSTSQRFTSSNPYRPCFIPDPPLGFGPSEPFLLKQLQYLSVPPALLMFMLFPQLPGETSSLKTLCQNETYFVKKSSKTFFHAVITSLRPHNLALFQSEDFPKTVLWGSRFRSNPKTFPSTAGSQRPAALSRKKELSIASCLEMCVKMLYCMSITSPFDHVPIRRPSHDRPARLVLPVQSEDLPLCTRQSAISFPLPKD